MKVSIDLCLVPMGIGVSVSSQIAQCQRIFAAAGLDYRLHAWGTTVEGDWDAVMAAVKSCHQTMHDQQVPRVVSTLKLGTRSDREQSMQDKIDSVERKLDGQTT